jgi:hypothetical protein
MTDHLGSVTFDRGAPWGKHTAGSRARTHKRCLNRSASRPLSGVLQTKLTEAEHVAHVPLAEIGAPPDTLDYWQRLVRRCFMSK